jgi:DNA-binding response OmpR family regulator
VEILFRKIEQARALAPSKSAAKVLVVDDSRLMHSLYECLLTDKDLVHASDAAEALGLLGEHGDTDLVVVDVDVPELGGLSVLEHVRKSARRVPVVLIAGQGHTKAIAHGLSAGASAYLTKPFHAHELIDVVDAVLLAENAPGPRFT